MRIVANISAISSLKQIDNLSSGYKKSFGGSSKQSADPSSLDSSTRLATPERLKVQVNELRLAARKALNGLSLVQTAESGLSIIHSMLERLGELVLQAEAKDSSSVNLQQIQMDISVLLKEINQVAALTHFNNKPLLGSSDLIPINMNADTMDAISFSLIKADAVGLKIDTINVLSDSQHAQKVAAEAIDSVATVQKNLGAIKARLRYITEGFNISSMNLSVSSSQIDTVDKTFELADSIKKQIVLQPRIATVTQANIQPMVISAVFEQEKR